MTSIYSFVCALALINIFQTIERHMRLLSFPQHVSVLKHEHAIYDTNGSVYKRILIHCSLRRISLKVYFNIILLLLI